MSILTSDNEDINSFNPKANSQPEIQHHLLNSFAANGENCIVAAHKRRSQTENVKDLA